MCFLFVRWAAVSLNCKFKTKKAAAKRAAIQTFIMDLTLRCGGVKMFKE
jgi:hypothetical protein